MIFSIFKKTYHPLNTIIISRDNLLYNYAYLTQLSKTKIAPVLKSNAYGHGIVEVATILDSVGAPFFCVDSLYEGYQLLKAHIKTPILIMGYVDPENLRVKKLPFSYAVYTKEMLDAVKKYQPHAGVHLFVDTGMHREGVALEDLASFAKKATALGLQIDGLMSHFAMADKPNSEETKQQVKNFKKAQGILLKLSISPKFIHIAASSGILHFFQHDSVALGNVGRAGIALYGIDPERKNTHLKPVLILRTKIIQVKEIKKGAKVGYDFTCVAKRDMKLAILPLGYNDGVNRELSSKGFVKIGDIFCPIVGRVSMNITIIDVSLIPRANVGNEVIIYSDRIMDKNSVQSASKLCDIIPYEILVQLHPTTKRIIV